MCECGEPFILKKLVSHIPKCKDCTRIAANKRARRAQYYKKPEYKEDNRRRRLAQYGLTVEQYDQLVEMQNGVCAICKKQPESVLVVDHCHERGVVRGLLCQKCNRAIGSLGDKYRTVQKAAAYLMRTGERDWDIYFVNLARMVATRSRDPSTQVGAVIVKDKIVLTTGYNGLPRGIEFSLDRMSRPLKYDWMVHGEENALLNAARQGISTQGSIVYVTPFHPCIKCTRAIIQAGVSKVVIDYWQQSDKWEEEWKISKSLFDEAKVEFKILSL